MKIQELFKDFRHGIVSYGKSIEAAVLIPLVEIDGEIHLILQLRASNLNAHSGEISFPGGKKEKKDRNFLETAVRETMEELGLQRESIEVICEMDTLVAPFNVIIYPFLGIIHDYESIRINQSEVDHIFTVPLNFFIDNPPSRYDIRVTLSADENFPYERTVKGKDYRFREGCYDSLFYDYEDYNLWGMTAKIIHGFIEHYKAILTTKNESFGRSFSIKLTEIAKDTQSN